MPDCDYCSDDFATEDAYLDHLQAEHYDELSRIDRRRVDQRSTESGMSTGQKTMIAVLGIPIVLGAAVLLLDAAGLADGIGFLGGEERVEPTGDDVIPEGIESEPLNDQGNPDHLEGVQTFDNLDRSHVGSGQDVNYDHVPPTGGPHYGGVVRPGFYEQRQPLGDLVHNLEHGHVVIYYDPAALDAEAEESLREYVTTYTDPWASVVVVPNPRDDPESAYVLTAWEHRLRMDDYDEDVVRAFLAEFLGRGPENPVR